MFDYFTLFKQCPSSLFTVRSPTEQHLHNYVKKIFSQVTTTASLDKFKTCAMIATSGTVFQLWHANLVWRYICPSSLQWPWTWCKVDARSGKANNQGWIILLTKQATSITLATTSGHHKFYFSLKSSVAFVLNYGHMGISCKTASLAEAKL